MSLQDVTLDAAGTLHIDLGAPDDPSGQLIATGTVTLAGTLTVGTLPGFTGDGSYTLIDNQGSGAVAGVFADPPQGAMVHVGAYGFHIAYTGGTGNDVVLKPNKPPLAVDDTYKIPKDQTLVVASANGTLANDSDADSDSLTAVVISGPSHGTLTFNVDGSFTYTPAAGFTGTDTFTYQAFDGAASSNTATVTITVVPGEKQLFDGDAVTPGADVTPLTLAQLQPLLDEAIRRWVAATGDAQVGVRLQQAQVHITALSDAVLGLEGDNDIWIDLDAAGHGWFVDPTPGDDSEFDIAIDGSERHAGSDSAAAGRVDLLTVLEHELGHVLGLSDDSGTDLMATTLGLGVRRLPGPGMP